MCTGEGCASSLQACVQGRQLSAQVSRIADIITDADSLYMRFPKLAFMKTEDGRLHLTFLNLAAELKFSLALPLGEHQCCPSHQMSQVA